MKLEYEAANKSIQNKLESIYLFYGEELFLIDNLIKTVKKKFGELVQGINYVQIDATSVDTLISNIEMPAFGYDKKLIIVRDSGLFTKDGRKKEAPAIQVEIAEYIKNNIDIIDESVCLVFVEEDIKASPVYEAISTHCIETKVNFLNEMQMRKKLTQICSLYKVNIEPNALAKLVETSGTNLQIQINEIRKLIEYAGEGGTIKVEDVEKLAIKEVSSVIFDLTDNLSIRNVKKAMEIYDDLIYSKTEDAMILFMLYQHFKKVLLYKIAKDNNKNIVKSLELRPNQEFLVKKYAQQASHYTQNQLISILHELADLDSNFKQGKIDLGIGLRSILCVYCS